MASEKVLKSTHLIVYHVVVLRGFNFASTKLVKKSRLELPTKQVTTSDAFNFILNDSDETKIF